MSEEETIGILAEMMMAGVFYQAGDRERLLVRATMLWAAARALGVEENLAEVALAWDLALQATKLDHADEDVFGESIDLIAKAKGEGNEA